jgi:hypothetical protein
VRVVGVCGVQSHLRAEPAQPTKQGVGAPLRGGRSHLQDPEVGTIHSFSLSVSFFINLFVTLNSMLYKKSTGVEPRYLDVWLPAYDVDGDAAENRVSNNIKCYA